MKKQHKPLARQAIGGILRSTKYGTMQNIYERIAPASDGAIHSFMNPAGTETTRFSHAATWLFDPGSTNLANLPKKTAMGDPLFNVRATLKPHEGRLLGAADYSQAEARWCAWMANDPVRIKLYEDGIDHYKWFVALLEWDDPDRWQEVSKKKRNSIGKVGVLSGQYQVGWRAQMQAVNDGFEIHGVSISARKAKKMAALWTDALPRTVEWWGEVREQVLTVGTTINPFGRRRMYFGRRDSSSGEAAVVREAIADGPQSANAMMLNKALRRLYAAHDPSDLRLLLQVHDEILFDCAPRDMKKVAKIVKNTMEFEVDVDGRPLVIPAEVSFTSKSWAEMKNVRV